MHRLVEIVERSGGDAIVGEAEIDFIEIEFENLVLRIGRFDSQAQEDFTDLAIERAVRTQKEVLRHLLGYGRGALDAARPLKVNDAGADDALGVEAPVRVEVLVLGRDERVLDELGNGGRRQRKYLLARREWGV